MGAAMAAIKQAALAMYYRMLGKQGPAAQEKAKADARSRLAEAATENVREAVRAFHSERQEVTDAAHHTIGLIVRANERIS